MKNPTFLFTSFAIAFLSVFMLNGCAEKAVAPNSQDGQTTQATQTTQVTPPTMNKPTSAQTDAPIAGDKVAIIETDLGTIKFKLFTAQVPEMTKNFEELAKAGKYNNVPFHRVIKDFMIQTGDFEKKNGMGGYSYKGKGTKLPDEIVPELQHLYGTVSMANSGEDTNGSQFFIVTNKDGTSFLDGGYTIFGQVYEGMDVALKIADLHNGDRAGTPTKIVNMKKVTVETL